MHLLPLLLLYICPITRNLIEVAHKDFIYSFIFKKSHKHEKHNGLCLVACHPGRMLLSVPGVSKNKNDSSWPRLSGRASVLHAGVPVSSISSERVAGDVKDLDWRP